MLGAIVLGAIAFGVCVAGRAHGQVPSGAARIELGTQAGAGRREPAGNVELLLGLPPQVPLCGPRYAPITVDVFVGLGSTHAATNLKLVARLANERSDVRTALHPVLGSTPAERGTEVLWEVCAQRQRACCPLIEQLAAHPDWLEPGPDAEELLLRGVAELDDGIDLARLRYTLRTHVHRAQIRSRWESEREVVRYPPETWINGRRLRGALTEPLLAEELERQRARAMQALRDGARLTELYDRLVREERTNNPGPGPAWGSPWTRGSPSGVSSPSGVMGGAAGPGSLYGVPSQGGLLDEDGSARSAPLELSRAPTRGPAIATVTVVLIGSLDSYGTHTAARAVEEVWERHPGALRMAFLHGTSPVSNLRIAQLVTALAITDEPMFWRVYTGLIEFMRARFMLRYPDVLDVMRQRGAISPRLEQNAARDPLVQQRLESDRRQAARVGPLPAVLVNGRLVRSPVTAESLERAVTRELERGLLERLAAARGSRFRSSLLGKTD